MRAVDIEKLVSVGRPTIHPDGDRAVTAVSHPDLGSDSVVSQLFEVRLDGSGSRRLTRGSADGSARFSPDGRMLAFLRAAGGPPQLHIVDAGGGEPFAITDQKLGVGSFAWSPDSSTIAFTSRSAEPGRYGTVEGLEADAEPPRRITTTRYTANGLGYTNDRRAQLFVVDVPGLDVEPVYDPAPKADQGDTPPAKTPKVPEARQLTTADADHHAPFFTTDGRHIAVIAALHATADLDLRSAVYRVAVDGSSPIEPVTDPAAPLDIAAAAYGDDGRLWFIAGELGESNTDFVARLYGLYVGAEAPTRLTDPETIELGNSAALIVPGSTEAIVLEISRGTERTLRISDVGDIQRLTDGGLEVGGADALDVAGEVTVVVSFATPESFGELGVISDGELQTITDFGAAIRDVSRLVSPTEEEHAGRDGYPVHGWVAIPDGPGPHPVLLMIHGGPFAQYGVHLFDETQVYAEAGYAVVYCNPRGANGYGRQHGLAIKEKMGTVDLDDVLAFLDGAVAAHPELDGERVGILGGSYGGYLTAWTIAHDHRFAAAVVERGFLDPEFFVGTSDIGTFFSQEYTGSDPVERAKQSPQAFVDQVTTPTLVVHSEQDLRCPLSQAERYYAALKANGVEAELLIFPGENHELSRSGRPRHRVQRFEAILEWFGRYLPVTAP